MTDAKQFLKDRHQHVVTKILTDTQSLWQHSGNPADPHAELTSGMCSDGFCDTLRAISYTRHCQNIAQMLVSQLSDVYRDKVHWVIGSDHAAATISHSVATLLGARHDFCEKGENKTQLWKRFTIEPGENVLQVEDLITTSLTFNAVRLGIQKGNPYPVSFVPFVMAIVHRSDIWQIDGDPILYLAHYDINVWDPKDCPLCAAGSERIRPKQNWSKLTGKIN